MADLYSARPFISHAGPNGDGVREEVLVTKGCGLITGILKQTDESASVGVHVPTLQSDLSGWINKIDKKTGKPTEAFEVIQEAIKTGDPVYYRIEHQRRPYTYVHGQKGKGEPIDPKTPIYELMGADKDGKNKQMNLVGQTTKKLLVAVGFDEDDLKYSQALTDPREDPGGNSGPTSAIGNPSIGNDTARGTKSPGSYTEVQPWFGLNPNGAVNPGSYAVDALIDYYFWVRSYAGEHGMTDLDNKRMKILASNLVILTDNLQIDVYRGGLEAPDRNIGSYREARDIVKKVATIVKPLSDVDVSSIESIKTWIDDVHKVSLEIWQWAIEDYARAVNASAYGD
jgi:hypothetical protein